MPGSPDKEPVLAKLDSLQAQPLIWVPLLGKPKAVRRPSAWRFRRETSHRILSFLHTPIHFFTWGKMLHGNLISMMGKHHCSLSTRWKLKDKSRFLIISHMSAAKIELFVGSEAVQQRCGQWVKGKLNLDVKDPWIEAFPKNLNQELKCRTRRETRRETEADRFS